MKSTADADVEEMLTRRRGFSVDILVNGAGRANRVVPMPSHGDWSDNAQ